MTFGSNDYPEASGPTTGYDQYGYALRQCTSFCAWRIANDYKLAVPAWGNGGQWWSNARAARIAVDGTPRAHDLMSLESYKMGAGAFGHVAAVLAVNSDGTVQLEDYDWVSPYNYGQHSMAVSGTSAGQHFIHIGGGGGSTTPGGTGYNAENETMGFVTQPDGTKSLFVNNGAGHIFNWWVLSDGQWNGPSDVTAQLSPQLAIEGEPAAATSLDGSGNTVVFRAAVDHKLYTCWYTGGKWYGPLQLPGQ